MDGRGFVVLFYVTGFCNSIESRRSGIVSLTCRFVHYSPYLWDTMIVNDPDRDRIFIENG